jgi:hypothetical protein
VSQNNPAPLTRAIDVKSTASVGGCRTALRTAYISVVQQPAMSAATTATLWTGGTPIARNRYTPEQANNDHNG